MATLKACVALITFIWAVVGVVLAKAVEEFPAILKLKLCGKAYSPPFRHLLTILPVPAAHGIQILAGIRIVVFISLGCTHLWPFWLFSKDKGRAPALLL